MTYTQKDYSHLLSIDGFSQDLLNNHFGLYNGYVANTNKLIDKLDTLEYGTPEYAEIQRRFGWEWNGMRMHELYFDSLTTSPSELDQNSDLAKLINETYSNFDEWKEDFKEVGKIRGIGWVVFVYDKQSGELFNTWIGEHDLGHLVGTTPLLIMDVFEHAYMLDYGMNKASYIETFMKHINWSLINDRFNS